MGRDKTLEDDRVVVRQAHESEAESGRAPVERCLLRIARPTHHRGRTHRVAVGHLEKELDTLAHRHGLVGRDVEPRP